MWEEIVIGAGSLILVSVGTKVFRAKPLLESVIKTVQNQIKARKDGKLTVKEKAKLYDDIESNIIQAHLILKGFFPNKSKK